MGEITIPDYISDLPEANLKFILQQVKFMYGKSFDKMKMYKYLNYEQESNISTINIKTMLDSESQDPINGLVIRNNYFVKLLKQFWDHSKDPSEFLAKVDWNDSRHYLEEVIVYNRPYDNRNQIIFPLENYQSPNSVFNNDTLSFNNKKNGILWRGATTGYTTMSKNKRCNIVTSNFSAHDDIDLGFNVLCQQIYANNKELLDKYCKPSKTIKEQLDYKFVLNIEGNDLTSSFPWALASNSCPLHNYPFSHESYFFGKGLEPYVHFVPIKNDGSDLVSQYHWCLENLEKCEEIANNGKKYMQDYLDPELYDNVIDTFIKIYPFKVVNA